MARDGYAARGEGDDRWTFARHAVCLSADGRTPAARWRNGGPVAVRKPTSGRQAPEWAARAVAYVATVGGVTAEEAGRVVEWYATHRTGQYGVRA